MKTCKAKCLQYFVHYFHLLILFAAIILLAIAVYGFNEKSTEAFTYFGMPGYKAIFTALVVSGALIVLISFLACCGAVVEHGGMLKMYVIIMGMLVVMMLAGSIMALVTLNDGGSVLEKLMKDDMEIYDTDKGAKERWDSVQSQHVCCGIKGAEDWNRDPLPDSCYNHWKHNKQPWSLGCLDQVNKFEPLMQIFGITGLVVSFILVFAITIVGLLLTVMKREGNSTV